VNQMVLDEETLGELSETVSNFRLASDRAVKTFDEVDRLLQSSGEPFSTSLTNFARFSEQLNELADDLNHTLAQNQKNISGTINNLEAASYNVKLMVADAQSGKGVLGSLLADEDLDRDLHELVHNLSILSSNLNRHGLLFRPRQPRQEADSDGLIRRFFFPGRQ
jgi:methyl-accepting chemotaxis protein